jgi:hypothetical protein
MLAQGRRRRRMTMITTMTEKAQKTYNRKTKSRLEASESFLEGVTF